MRTLSSFFHAAPSDEFTVRPLVGLQHVWKRIFEHLMDRGDTYKRTAFNNLHDKNKNLEEDTYADLRVLHDALSIERDILMDAYNKPPTLSAELVSEAHGYKSRAKLLHKDVLKALESAPPSLPSSRRDSLLSYRFPSPPSMPPTKDPHTPSKPYFTRAHMVTESTLSLNTVNSDRGRAEVPLLERSRPLNVPHGILPVHSGCPRTIDKFASQQYHMYMHEDALLSGSSVLSGHSTDACRRSNTVQISDVLEWLDSSEGNIDVDTVIGLLQSVDGPVDNTSLAHVVELVKARCGKETAIRLQSELDDRVRASSSSA